MVARYVPGRGDLIWLEFDPQSGREQAKRRPALVLSPIAYNRRSSLAIVCPVTSQEKGYPFEVPLPRGMKTKGVVLADQLKSLDWRARKAKRIEKVPSTTLHAVLEKAVLLLER